MTSKRWYDERCGIAHALNLVGERWALLIVRDLLLGPKRFTDLQAGLPAASSSRLAQRLRDLETNGVVRRRTLPPPAGSQVYELTEWGHELDPILAALGRWGTGSPTPAEGNLGADSVMLELREYFNPNAIPAWTASYEIRLGRDRFTARVTDGHLTDLTRGQPHDKPDAVLDTDPTTLDNLLGGPRHGVTEAVNTGHLTLTGDTDAGQRLLDAITTR